MTLKSRQNICTLKYLLGGDQVKKSTKPRKAKRRRRRKKPKTNPVLEVNPP
jgi:hypothetical protein